MEECYPMAFDEHYANMMSDMFLVSLTCLVAKKTLITSPLMSNDTLRGWPQK